MVAGDDQMRALDVQVTAVHGEAEQDWSVPEFRIDLAPGQNGAVAVAAA
jgi:hypothetical protein